MVYTESKLSDQQDRFPYIQLNLFARRGHEMSQGKQVPLFQPQGTARLV